MAPAAKFAMNGRAAAKKLEGQSVDVYEEQWTHV